MLQIPQAFTVRSRRDTAAVSGKLAGPVRELCSLLSPEEQRGGPLLACCYDTVCVVRSFAELHGHSIAERGSASSKSEAHKKQQRSAPALYSIPKEASTYAVWSILHSEVPLSHRNAIIYAHCAPRDATINARGRDTGKENEEEEEHSMDPAETGTSLNEQRQALWIQTPRGDSFPLLRTVGENKEPIYHLGIQQIRIFYVSPMLTILSVLTSTSAFFYSLPVFTKDKVLCSALIERVFLMGTAEEKALPSGVVLEGAEHSICIEVPGGRRSAVLLDGCPCKRASAGDDREVILQVVLAACEGSRLHVKRFVLSQLKNEMGIALQLCCSTEEGKGLPLPSGCISILSWSIDWKEWELVIRLEPSARRRREADVKDELLLARLPLRRLLSIEEAASSMSSEIFLLRASEQKNSSHPWLLASTSSSPYLNAVTRPAIGRANQLVFSALVDSPPEEMSSRRGSVFAIVHERIAGGSFSAADYESLPLVLVKDVGSSTQSEYQLMATTNGEKKEGEGSSSAVLASVVFSSEDGSALREELLALLGSTLFRIPFVEPSASLTSASSGSTGVAVPSQQKSESLSLCDVLLQESPAPTAKGSCVVETAEALASAVLKHLEASVGRSGASNDLGETVPPVIRDYDFVCPSLQCDLCRSRPAPRHAVLDKLLSSSETMSSLERSPSIRRQLLLYIAFCESLHPVTVCRTLLWGNKDKGLLLALAAALSAKRELQVSDGPARLVDYPKWAMHVYQTSLLPTTSTSPMQQLWEHSAALADASLAALAVGAHSSLILLVHVLRLCVTALYASNARGGASAADSTSLAAVHQAEARVTEAVRLLSDYSIWSSHVSSLYGNITAHLPAVEAIKVNLVGGPSGRRDGEIVVENDVERKKEAVLRPRVSRPIAVTREVDIAPLPLFGSYQ